MDARRTRLPNMDLITCSKADIEPMLRKLILHLHFTKSLNRDRFELC